MEQSIRGEVVGQTLHWLKGRGQLVELARQHLGNRSPKSEAVPAAAEPSEPGLPAAVREPSQIRMTFLDPVRASMVSIVPESRTDFDP